MVTMDQTLHSVQTEMRTTVLHTEAAAEGTLTVLATMETLEIWDRAWVIKTAEAQAEAEEQEETGNTEEQAAEAAQAGQQAQEETLLQVMVLVHQDTKVDLVGDQEHQVEHQDLTTAGHHGSAWADLVAKVNTV
jgi:hypothetical protein